MKKILYFIILFSMFCAAGSVGFGQATSQGGKVIAYYFHGSFRCATCINMENYTNEAIQTNYKDALQTGKLEFKVVDVEMPENEHYVDKYKIYTKTLILSVVKDGKEIQSKNLNKIWEYARDKQKFIAYVTEEINNVLKEVS